MSINHWEDGKPSASKTGKSPRADRREAGGLPADGGSFVFPVVAPKTWADWETWGQSLGASTSGPLQGALSLVAPVGVDASTGAVAKPGRVARLATDAARKSGVFKNAVSEPCAPNSNTGAQNSKPEITTAVVDYVRCTFRGADALEKAKTIFGAGEDWQKLDHSAYKYAFTLKRGDVSIHYGGEYYNQGLMREHDTVLVVASGKGCRQLEHEGLINGFGSLDNEQSPWQAFFGDLLAMGCTFPRVDVAIDDVDGLLNLDQMQANIEAGICSTRFRQWERKRPGNFNGGIDGDSLILGNRQSMMFVRIYNKHLEQIAKGELPPEAKDEPVHWLRCELEAHDEKATKLAQAIYQYGMRAAAAALWSAVDFKDENDNEDKHNRARRKTAEWWEKFICVAEKLPLTLAPKIRTMEKVVKWLASSVAPSLALIDCLPEGAALLDALIENGGERLRAVHVAMLKQSAETGSNYGSYVSRSCAVV